MLFVHYPVQKIKIQRAYIKIDIQRQEKFEKSFPHISSQDFKFLIFFSQ